MRILDIEGFVNEKIKIVPLSDEEFNNMSDDMYNYHPKTKKELQSIIDERIKKEGNECNLNDIDTSEITDMSELFTNSSDFNGNISGWDVSNVTSMSGMFDNAKSFNGDISGWNVSNVKNMDDMFCNAENFNGDISGWDVSNVVYMYGTFCRAKSFNQDISGWNVSDVKCKTNIFEGCPMKNQPEKQPKFK